MNENTIKSLIQVNSIISVLPENKINNIPTDILDRLSNAKLKGYIFKYDYSKDILEQEINDEAKDILFNIYINYITTKEELDIINERIKIIEGEII